MAGLLVAYKTPAITLTGNTTITALRVQAPVNQRLVIRRFGCSFYTTANSYTLTLKKGVGSDGTATSLTGVILGPGSETIQSAAKHTFTVEPSAGGSEVFGKYIVGAWDSEFLFPDQFVVPVNTYWSLLVTTPNGATGTLACLPYMIVEE